MPRLYDITWTKPPQLVERYLRVEVDERINAKGEVERPLAGRTIAARRRGTARARASRRSRSACCTPTAIPVHEQMIKAIAARHRAAAHALHQLRGAARDQGIRAHLDDRHQRLCAADRRALPNSLRREFERIEHRCAAAVDAVEWRSDDRRAAAPTADAHHRIGTRGRRRRRAGLGAADRHRRRRSPSTWAAPPPRRRSSRTAR